MRLISADSDKLTVEVSRDDLVVLAQAMNEVLNGPEAIEEPEFQTRMGVEIAEAERLHEAVRAVLG